MRYPNAKNREGLLESIDNDRSALHLVVKRFLAGEAPTRCKNCGGELDPSQCGPLYCHACGIGWDPRRNDWVWKKWGEHGWTAPIPHVYCDFNNTAADDRVRLNTRGSKESLEKCPVFVGERVLLTDEDIYVEGVIEDQGYEYFVAKPDWSTRGDHCTECGGLDAKPDADALNYFCHDCAMKLAGCRTNEE